MAHTNTDEWDRRQVAALAWREAKATADVHHLLGEVCRAMDSPPASFINEELGFGFGEGPSIISTLQDLDRTNKAHRHKLEKQEKKQRRTADAIRQVVNARLSSASA